MKCLLVVCHPLKDSLNAALAETVARALRQAGHELCIRDLYEQGFQPALTANELQSFRRGPPSAAAAAAETDELQAAEVLVLVFPTWWFSLPAMLKGWFDRVWAPGIAYDLAPDAGVLHPRLHSLKRTIAITTLGSPWWVDWFVLRRPVKRILKRSILGPCAPRSKLDFLSFYGCDKLTERQGETMKQRVSAAIGRI
jgi:NAD(P)H dehydrogenase (quinone)